MSTSRFPFPRYPNGWFQVAYSDELKPGAVLPLKYFGRDLVLFRTETGQVHVLDAHCPHLGAHLGYGGTVKDGCIRCPFHAWRYDGTGQCVEVPYSTRIPPKARVKPWHVKDVNGLILVWHHLGGHAPTWDIEPIPEFASPEWTPYDLRRWKVRTHNQEMAENAVDSAHFHYVHGTLEMPTSRAVIEGPIMRVVSDTLMKTPMGKVKGQVESISYGFGYALTRFTGIVETLLVASITPIDDEYVDVRFSFAVKKLPSGDATSTVGAAFIREVERQLGQDIPIWENKIYVSPPLLAEGDGPVGVFRRWCKQFYQDGSEPVVELRAIP
jgi:phenylpropionate dioxygenase-like ring-hydroxylating dioxygenase large terminal subunit